jgi:Ca-activated chloride channel family protein
MYNGKEVWSKLAGDKLRQIVFPTGGKFLPVGPGETFNLDQIYNDYIATAQKRELESLTMMKYDEKFQIFLVLAIGLIICEALISERKKT